MRPSGIIVSVLRALTVAHVVAVGLTIAGVATDAHAGGYFTGTKGARASGRYGAFTARADDSTAVWINPAGLARIGTTEIAIGNRFSYNASQYSRVSTQDWGDASGGVAPTVDFGSVSNQTPWQAADPLLAVASNFGLRDWGFAASVHSPAGVAREQFPLDGGQRYMMVRREAIMLNYSLAAAWKYRDRVGVGVAFHWLHVPKLEYSVVIDANQFAGQANPVSSELDMLATTRGRDIFTPNLTFGLWFRVLPALELAASAQVIPASIRTKSTLSLSPVDPDFEGDVELTRRGVPSDDVSLELPMPITARIGARYIHVPQGRQPDFDVELDIGYESTSMVDGFTLDGEGLVGEAMGQRLDVGRIVIDKQWRDTVSIALGSDVTAIPDRFVVRGGLGWDSAVAPRSHANVDFLGGHQVGGSVGFSVLVKGFDIAMSYAYRHQIPVNVAAGEGEVYQQVPGSQCEAPYTDPDTCHPEYLGQPAPTVNEGRYEGSTHAVSLDFRYRF